MITTALPMRQLPATAMLKQTKMAFLVNMLRTTASNGEQEQVMMLMVTPSTLQQQLSAVEKFILVQLRSMLMAIC